MNAGLLPTALDARSVSLLWLFAVPGQKGNSTATAPPAAKSVPPAVPDTSFFSAPKKRAPVKTSGGALSADEEDEFDDFGEFDGWQNTAQGAAAPAVGVEVDAEAEVEPAVSMSSAAAAPPRSPPAGAGPEGTGAAPRVLVQFCTS